MEKDGILMSTIMYYTVISIDVAFVICSFILLWINTFATRNELDKRNASIMLILRSCLATMVLVATLVSLMSDSFEDAITKTTWLYFMIMLTMVLVVFVSLIIVSYRVLSRRVFIPGTDKALRKLIFLSIIGAVISGFLGWVLS